MKTIKPTLLASRVARYVAAIFDYFKMTEQERKEVIDILEFRHGINNK